MVHARIRPQAWQGSSRIYIEVDDLDEAIRDLTAKGVVFNAPPVALSEGSFVGSKWAYLRDPDGIQLEIWESAFSSGEAAASS